MSDRASVPAGETANGFLSRWGHWFPIFVLGGLLFRILLAWMPLGFQLRYLLPDDAFYYFTIARNAARGHGLTFDMLSETNGFHPLWMLVLIVLSTCIGTSVSIIPFALSLCAVLDTLSLLVVRELLHILRVRPPTTLIVSAVYAFNPAVLSHSGPLNGMETALNSFLLLLFLWFFMKFAGTPGKEWRTAVIFGLLAGLALLARTDNMILGSLSFLFLFLFGRSREQTLAAALIAVAIVSPWLVWSHERFGTIVQSSTFPVAYMTKFHLFGSGWTWTDTGVQFIKNMFLTFTFFPTYLSQTRLLSTTAGFSLVPLMALALCVTKRMRERWPEQKELFRLRAQLLAVPLIGAILFVGVHTVRAIFMRSWYYASIVPVLFLVLACLVDFCIESAARRKVAIRMIVAIIAVQLSLAFFLLTRPHVGEVDKYSMAVVLNRSLAEGTRIGSWNAGLYGYFFERGSVVGLDGLVSNAAARHVLDHSLGKFIAESNIDYLVDSEGAFRYAAPFLGLTRDALWPPQDPAYEVWGKKEKSMIVAVPNPIRER